MSGPLELRSHSPRQTWQVGQAIGRGLSGGELIALEGPLGSGKTQFVKGLAAGLDVPGDEPVVSPTFVLVREYVGRLRLYHVDAYRLGSADELAGIGLDEMLEAGGTVAVEWADRVADGLPAPLLRIDLAYGAGPTERTIRIDGPDELLARLAASLPAATAPDADRS